MADDMVREDRKRKARLAGTTASLLSFALVIMSAFLVPKALEKGAPEAISQGMNASIFSTNSALGFIVIGVIAFLLGVALTVFCFRLKDWEDDKNSEEGYDR